MHNVCIFSNCDVYAKGESVEHMPSGIRRNNNVDMPVMILRDYVLLTKCFHG